MSRPPSATSLSEHSESGGHGQSHGQSPGNSPGHSPGHSPDQGPSQGTRPDRSTSVSSTGSGTPRRRTYHIAPVSMGGPKRSPRPSVSESASPPSAGTAAVARDDIAAYMSQLAVREARVSELRETLKSIELELQAAEFDLAQFRKTGSKLAHTLRSTPPRPLARASTTDLERGVRDRISRSPSPQRVPKESQVKRVVGEIGSQFWSFVEDVRTAALGEDDEDESSDSDHDTNRRHRRAAQRHFRQEPRDPDPTQYM